jgi:hypothetical protein
VTPLITVLPLIMRELFSCREVSFPDPSRRIKSWQESTFPLIVQVIRDGLSLPDQGKLKIYTFGMREVTSTDLSDVQPFQPGEIRLVVGVDGKGNPAPAPAPRPSPLLSQLK